MFGHLLHPANLTGLLMNRLLGSHVILELVEGAIDVLTSV